MGARISAEEVPEQIQPASRAAERLAEVVGSTNVSAPVDAIEGWMRESYSAAASDALAKTWKTLVDDLARAIDDLTLNSPS